MLNKNRESSMLKEINEQPKVIVGILKAHLKKGKIFFPELDKQAVKLKKIKKAIIIACGSSYYAGIYAKYVFEEYAGIEVCQEYAAEFNSRDSVKIDKSTVIIAISQSGKTADVLKAVKKAKGRAGLIISITNSPESKLAGLSDAVLDCAAGEETALAATKSFSSTLLLLLLLGLFWTNKANKKIIENLSRLPIFLASAAGSESEIKKIALKFKKTEHFLFCGRKYYYPLALEGAHKMKECSYIHSEGLPTGELKHGTLAIIDKGMPVLFLLPNDDHINEDLEVMKAAKNAGGKIITLSGVAQGKLKEKADNIVCIKDLPEAIAPIVISVPLQMLAFYMSSAKGLDPDKPRNLNKFVG
jgi:glucosamine--fructose-6-phosphate aminotransferase (isomerizing)